MKRLANIGRALKWVACLTLAFMLVGLPRTAWSQPSEDEKEEPKTEKAADEEPDEEKADEASTESEPDEEEPDEEPAEEKPDEEPAEEKPDEKPAEETAGEKPAEKPAPEAPEPVTTPSPDPVSAKSPDGAPTGAIVIALSKVARVHARSLARAVYKDHVLRPSIDEATAQVLSGHPAPKKNATLGGHASLVSALGTTEDEEVQRRLAGSLGRDLGARLVILVSVRAGEPTARVIRMPEERMLAVKLTATRDKSAKTATWSWSDTTSMLRELSIGAPPPGPRKKVAGGTNVPTPEPEDEDDGNLLTSPWFWGGLGLVVTVGATVLILSQTALNEPDVVMIDGRVNP